MGDFEKFYEKFIDFLRTFGLKNSNQKEQILRILFTSNQHLSANEIREKLDTKISLTAIYQFLNFLCENSLALAFDDGGIKKFELNLKSHHDHLICQKCGKIESFCDNKIEKRQDEICKKFDFFIEGHMMILYGICKNCQEK